ncbi:MAG: carotenoid oxygenase [Actinophytocola sp.]|nr:carotenoid oxygenase [Actinophytocola sp.]
MTNPYLEGNFAPISTEHTATDLPVTGTIPEHLDGRYLRNGPNPIGEIDPRTYNWFVGDGMVHGIRIRDGKAEWYRNRWVRNGPVADALGEPRRGRTTTGMDLATNTNVIGHAGKTFALVEGGAPVFELTEELESAGPCDFDGTLPGAYTAHPQRDPATGELHAVSYYFGWGNRVQYTVLDRDGRVRRAVDIEVSGSPMMHNFSLTEKHVLIYDLPVTFDTGIAAAASVPRFLRGAARLTLSALIGNVRIPDPMAAAASRQLKPNASLPYSWSPRYPARIGVLPRDGASSDVRWFDIDPCYVFHPVNAYDNGDTIVVEVPRSDRVFDKDLSGPGDADPVLDRWEIDLTAGKVRTERIDDVVQEFPRIDERLLGRRHRYAYTSAAREQSWFDSVLKHDVSRATSTVHTFGEGKEIGEFVFVPSTADAAEDDGVLMGFVYDKASDRSDLTMLDAATLEPVASIHLPTRVPAGFHGNWVPTAA